MDITHNQINRAIEEMERISSKGQPYAKANKERQVRVVLRDMRDNQAQPPTLRDLWCYSWMWLRGEIRNMFIWVVYTK